MKTIIILFLAALLAGCGSGIHSCDGVDTSQAPDTIIYNGNSTTYVWESCYKTYEGGSQP